MPHIETLEHEHPYITKSFNKKWQYFVEAGLCNKSRLQKIETLIRNNPQHRRAWALSNYVSSFWIKQLATTKPEIPEFSPDAMAKLNQRKQRILACTNKAQFDAQLREIRAIEIARIAWQDLNNKAPLLKIVGDLSDLADLCLQRSVLFHSLALHNQFGVPWSKQKNKPASLIIIAMGKLGGKELNFSSDIDLIFAYDYSGQTNGANCIDNQQFFTKLSQRVISSLNEKTREGFVFRVDTRLRPNGGVGAIVSSLSALENYYRDCGREWERYAFVKARVVFADASSKKHLSQITTPFVYRKYLDYSAFDSLRAIKDALLQSLSQHEYTNNIKKGWGGIREAEFIIQSHQLIHGGKNRNLRSTGFSPALQALTSANFFSEKEEASIKEAYAFLRNTEHRLQMVDDHQTHSLPSSKEAQENLAVSMRFFDWEHFHNKLQAHRSVIQSQFEKLLNIESSSDLQKNHNAKPKSAPSKTPESLLRLEQSFYSEKFYKSLPATSKKRVDRLISVAIKEMIASSQPSKTMTSFLEAVTAIGLRSSYFVLLYENRLALQQMLSLCRSDLWFAKYIGTHPAVIDKLLTPMPPKTRFSQQHLEKKLAQRMQQESFIDDEEQYLYALREFQQEFVLRIAAAEVALHLSDSQARRALSNLAIALLAQCLKDIPPSTTSKDNVEIGVIAYGKLAGKELGYYSDLDVVLCYTSTNYSNEHEKIVISKARKLLRAISTSTILGKLYEVDMQLRPSGKRGMLTSSFSSFLRYQQEDAWLWENQALTRSALIIGSKSMAQSFEQTRYKILTRELNPKQVREELSTMRKKMHGANCKSTKNMTDIKMDVGGIIDIEFLVQYWLLIYGYKYPDIIKPRTISGQIKSLSQHKIISNKTATILNQTYKRYLQITNTLKREGKQLLIPTIDCKSQQKEIVDILTEIML